VSTILRFKISLLEISPVVWRRIEVPRDYSFWDLHVAIQDSMGWFDSHLHAFEVPTSDGGYQEVGIPDPDGESGTIAGWRRRLSGYFKQPGDQLIYEYDFGDSWRHSVMLEGILLSEPGVAYPRCIDGQGRCPPEDCGGPTGYEELLAAISDPNSPQHEEMLAWCGGSFDPHDFDAAEVEFDDPKERRKELY
jgi:hypothetical protein